MEWIKHLPIGQAFSLLEGVFLLETLKACGGNRTHAAKFLKITTKTLRRRLDAFIIQYPAYSIPPSLLQVRKPTKMK